MQTMCYFQTLSYYSHTHWSPSMRYFLYHAKPRDLALPSSTNTNRIWWDQLNRLVKQCTYDSSEYFWAPPMNPYLSICLELVNPLISESDPKELSSSNWLPRVLTLIVSSDRRPFSSWAIMILYKHTLLRSSLTGHHLHPSVGIPREKVKLMWCFTFNSF